MVGLAIPDRRHTFDWLRRESTLAEAVEAHLLGLTRPSIRQVFDAAAMSVPADGRCADSPEVRAEVLARLPSAFALAQTLVRTPQYRDAHCWVFTPSCFLDLLEELTALDLFPFSLAAFHPTEGAAGEFHVRLTAAPADRREIARSLAVARASLHPQLYGTPEPRTGTI
jgi:hypothetical protein